MTGFDTTSVLDLKTSESALVFAHTMMGRMHQNFVRDGYLQPVAFVLGCDPPRAIRAKIDCFSVQAIASDAVMISTSRLDSTVDKEKFSYLIRAFAQASHAHGVLFASEAWLASVKPEEATKALEDGLAEYPGRTEVLVATMEHRGLPDRFAQWTADIIRDGQTVTLKDFVEFPLASVSGQFVEFLTS